jgi:two-component system, LytTR family, sensor histidine kinase NatK
LKQHIWYWIYIGIFSSLHVQALFRGFSLDVHTAVTVLGLTPILIILYKRVELSLSVLGLRWNFALVILQCVLLPVYIETEPAPIHGALFPIFIGLEVVRISWSGKISELTRVLHQFEEERKRSNDTFRIVRSERHDFLKHISALHFMLEKSEAQEAKAYLDDLVDGYEETNLSIKGERGSVAGILHDMYRRGKKSGIDMIYDLDKPLSTLPLSDKDIVTLLGNLLSNSLDAAEDYQSQKGKQAEVTLQFYKRGGLYLLICQNHSLPVPVPILDKLYTSYGLTTKDGDHEGIGTKLIDDIVRKHKGFLDFVHKEERFIVKIKFPAIH